jgi:hypothetical protein
MKLKKTAVKATLAGALGAAAVGLGAGLSHADPFLPPPWPTPTDPGLSVQGPSVSGPGIDLQGPSGSIGSPFEPGASVEGPSVNGPGVSLQGPSGSIAPPPWAPPQPPPPPWAPFAPVQWNAEANVWGVYTAAGFQPVQ